MPISINGKPLKKHVSRGRGPHGSTNALPIEKYEEALRLKESYSLTELAERWGLTKNGAASRVYRARRILDAR